MNLRLDIISEEMTEREVAALSRELGGEIYRARWADSINPVRESSREEAKGFVDVIGSFLVGLPVEAITGVFDVIKAIASRSGQPPFTMKITRDATEVSFDPRRITPEEVAALAERLRPPE